MPWQMKRSCHNASLGTTSNMYGAVNIYFNSFLIVALDRYGLLTLLLGKDLFTEFFDGLVDHGVIQNAGQKSLSLLEIEP